MATHQKGEAMSDTPQDKLAANSQASKGMGEGANHPFEATGREWWEAQNHIRDEAPQAPSDMGEAYKERLEAYATGNYEYLKAEGERRGADFRDSMNQQAPSLFLNEPEGIQANRKDMGYVADGTPVVGFKGQAIEGRIIVLKASLYEREQEELRLLRNIGTLASQVKEANLGIWQGPFEELESACYDLEVFHNPNPFHSGAVELPEAEGRVEGLPILTHVRPAGFNDKGKEVYIVKYKGGGGGVKERTYLDDNYPMWSRLL